MEYAKKVCNENRVLGVIGGFHLFNIDNQLKKTIEYLNNNKVIKLYLRHCTSFSIRAEMYKTLEVKEVGIGLELER